MESLEQQEAEQKQWLKDITALNNALKGEPPCNSDGSKVASYEVTVYKVDDYFNAKGYTVIPPQSNCFDYSVVLGFYPPEFDWVKQASQINGMYHVLKTRGDTVQFAAGFLTAIINGSLVAYIGYMKTNKKFYDQGLPQQFMLDLQHSMVYKDPLENRSVSYVVLGALEPAAKTAFTESQGLSADDIPLKIKIAQEGRIMLWKMVDLPEDPESLQSLQDGINGTKQLQEKRIKAMQTSMERTPQKATRPISTAPPNKARKKQVLDVAMEEEEKQQSLQNLRAQQGPTLLNNRDNKSAAKSANTNKAPAQSKGKPGKSIQEDRVVSSPSACSDDDDDDDVEMEDYVSDDSQKKKSQGKAGKIKAQSKRLGVSKAISEEDDGDEEDQPQSEPESLATTKSMKRRDKHCYYGKCNGKFHQGIQWARHLKAHKVDGKPDESMFSLCFGTGCGDCIKCKYCDIAPQYRDIAPQYRDIAPQYRDIAPQYRDIAPQYRDTASQYRDIASHYTATLNPQLTLTFIQHQPLLIVK